MSTEPTAQQQTPGATISLVANGQQHTTTARTLHEWVQSQGVLAHAVATAVNGEFVARAARAQYTLKDGDVVLTFQPIQGG